MNREVSVEERLCEISEKAQLAMLLDILTPKPGNVHRYRDHPDTRIIHFAASITQLIHPLYKAAEWGYHLQSSGAESNKLGVLIKRAVQASMKLHEKNTLLGTILLLIPLAIAAGNAISTQKLSKNRLRQSLTQILHNSNVTDAIEFVRALQIASPGGAIPKSPEWTPRSQTFDFQSPHTIALVRRENYTILNLQALAASYDSIAQEYTTDFAYTFNTLYPQMIIALNRYARIEDAVLASYLWTLSDRPDTFIQRKGGPKAAQQVMEQAQKIYARIIKTPARQWHEYVTPFDEYLHSKGSELNPGTTADLLSGALFIALLLENIKLIF
ncbi:MAG: triphosphoribosyl-dephospho-CoA synthase [Candidatus Hermodarchaeota archaeon]|nr:triphosphoribosyl-dephospho-CoA synthase [Candidatus Hermodarchaeota archaeon]